MAATNIPPGVTPGIQYLSAELRKELHAATEMLRRTILPPPSPPKGEVLTCVDAQVFPGRNVVLAHWKGERGGDGCTVYGSRSPDQPTAFLTGEVAAQLQVRRGAVTRIERWPWPEGGFVRRVAAEEVVLTAVPYTAFVSGVPFYRLGASVQSGIVPRDHVAVYGGATPAGMISNQVFAPQGCCEFRMQAIPSLGTCDFQFAHESAPGVLTAFGSVLNISYAEDWTPWPAAAAGLVIVTGIFTTEFAV